MLETLAKMIVDLVDLFMDFFRIGYFAERHISQGNIVGESPLDREAEQWQRKVIGFWWFVRLLIGACVAGGGIYLWHRFAK